MKVCTASQMRAIDKSAWELGGIPSIVLMENRNIRTVFLRQGFLRAAERSVRIR